LSADTHTSHSLIAHPKDRVSTLQDVQTLPFFSSLPFASLRQRDAPFVPMLDGETDVGYFDSFESPEDMAKYAEVFKKQRDVEAVEEKGQGKRNNWVGFTFGRNAVSWGKAEEEGRLLM
jgi:non-specific serine/threonine protein kinase